MGTLPYQVLIRRVVNMGALGLLLPVYVNLLIDLIRDYNSLEVDYD
jgi:hypothetical protein